MSEPYWVGEFGNMGIVSYDITEDDRRAEALLPVGASLATLRKRARYGGRKGRSAARRLRAVGASLVSTIDRLTNYLMEWATPQSGPDEDPK